MSPAEIRRRLRVAQGYAELGLVHDGLQELSDLPETARCMRDCKDTLSLLVDGLTALAEKRLGGVYLKVPVPPVV